MDGASTGVKRGATATDKKLKKATEAAVAGALLGALIGKFKTPPSPSVTVLKTAPEEPEAPNMATAPGATVVRTKTPVDVSNPTGMTAPTTRMIMPTTGGTTSGSNVVMSSTLG
jgi:hypothetical protein